MWGVFRPCACRCSAHTHSACSPGYATAVSPPDDPQGVLAAGGAQARGPVGLRLLADAHFVFEGALGRILVDDEALREGAAVFVRAGFEAVRRGVGSHLVADALA